MKKEELELLYNINNNLIQIRKATNFLYYLFLSIFVFTTVSCFIFILAN